MFSAYSGCVECIAAILDLKPGLEEKDAAAGTALMYAFGGLQGAAAKRLVGSGANPNTKNSAGGTPNKFGLRAWV